MSLLISQFRDKVSKLKDYKMKVETEYNVGYPTGYLAVDFRNGMVVTSKLPDGNTFKYYSIGIADGSLCMFIGRSGCGKTTWLLQAAGNIIRPFENSCIFYDDIEGGATDARTLNMTGLDPDEAHRRIIHRNTGITAENLYARIKMISDMKLDNRSDYEYDTGLYDNNGNRVYKLQPTVYIVDSWALLMPGTYTDEDEVSGQMSATATARQNAAILKRIIPLLKASNIILFIINHINQKVEINPMMHSKAQVSYLKQGETLPGGNAAIYLSNNIFRFDNGTKLKEKDTFGIDGEIVDVTLVKSRSNKAGQSVPLVFNQEEGFDPDLSLLVFLKDRGRLGGAGAYLCIDIAPDIKFSQRNFKQKLYENSDLMAAFNEVALEELKTMLSDQENSSINRTSTSATNQILNMIKPAA